IFVLSVPLASTNTVPDRVALFAGTNIVVLGGVLSTVTSTCALNFVLPAASVARDRIVCAPLAIVVVSQAPNQPYAVSELSDTRLLSTRYSTLSTRWLSVAVASNRMLLRTYALFVGDSTDVSGTVWSTVTTIGLLITALAVFSLPIATIR